MRAIDNQAVRRRLGRTGLQCSPLGFGTYRVMQGNTTHAAAVRRYLELGGNLLDTSANYGLGSSELMVGQAARESERDDLILVTKAGYIQRQNKMTAAQLQYPEIVRFSPDAWHCIHPRFLKDQLDLSLMRLGVDIIDVYLLHNPEYFLKDAQASGQADARVTADFYRRIANAFAHLESEVARGRIRWYGISSNTFGAPASDFGLVELTSCLRAADALGADHHFGVIQLPLNLFEPGGALEVNNQDQTMLELSRTADLGVLVNRPLNALHGGHLVRLADSSIEVAGGPDAGAALTALEQHELAYAELFDFPLARGGMGVSRWVGPALEQIDSMDAYRGVIRDTLVPVVETWLMNADRQLRDHDGYDAWRTEFARRLDALIDGIQDRVAGRLTAQADSIRRRLTAAGLDREDMPLSQLALATLLGVDGVSCVLNGMRTRAYVDDSMQTLAAAPLNGHDVLQRLQRQTDA